MNDDTPLLKSIGYQCMLETMGPEDASEAKALLRQFLHDFTGVETEKVAILAYLLGVKQGVHEMCDEGRNHYLEEKIYRAHRMGLQHGYHHMAIMFGAEPTIKLNFSFKDKSKWNIDVKPPGSADSKNE